MMGRIMSCLLLAPCLLFAAPMAKFQRGDLVIRDPKKVLKIEGVVAGADSAMIHSLKKKDGKYYLLYYFQARTNDRPMGHCGAGIEASIVWMEIDSGKIQKQVSTAVESCNWMISPGGFQALPDGKFTWEADGPEVVYSTSSDRVTFHWTYDSNAPEKGVAQTITKLESP